MTEEEVLARAWPDGAAATDKLILSELAPDDRSATLLRLEAVLLAEEPGADIGPLAARLELSRVAFFRLRKRWREERSLRSLVPYLRRQPRRLGPRSSGSLLDVSAAVRDIVVRADPAKSTSELARSVVASLGGGTSLQTATRLVRAERTRLALDPSYLRQAFGRELLLDISAVSLAEAGEPPVPICVAVVIERSSRLVVGHAAGRAQDGGGLQQGALIYALNWLEREQSVEEAPQCAVEIALAPGEPEALSRIADCLRSLPEVRSVAWTGSRRFGERLVSLVGHRIDRLRLRPRSTGLDHRQSVRRLDLSWPPTSLENASALVAEAVRNHNEPIFDALKQPGLEEEISKGRTAMRNALRRIYSSCRFNPAQLRKPRENAISWPAR